jgi:transcription termination/antitermination protein NusA
MSNKMSNREILVFVDSISNEKGIEKETIFTAIEKALEAITARGYKEPVDIRVSIDRTSGDYQTFRQWTLIDDAVGELEFPSKQMFFSKAKETINPDLEVGDVVEELIDSIEFGRIDAQQAKQVIMREIHNAEREETAKNYREKINTLLAGMAKKVTHSFVLLDMGNNIEGLIQKEELIPREVIKPGDRVRGILYAISDEPKGPQLLISRTHRAMLTELFKLEVPEIAEDVIEIKAVARDPGSRAKIAVKTNDGRIDPIGACIGIRGARVQTVSNELSGERIDIILWDDNPAQLVVNAMAPAEIASIIVNETDKSMNIGVREDQLALAIGRSGQNVRLASELSGWKLNVLTEADIEKKSKSDSQKIVDLFKDKLGVDEELANVLIQEGFRSLEDIAYVAENEMMAIEGFDKDLVEAIRNRARDILLQQTLTSKISVGTNEPASDLLALEGMTRHLAYVLASRGIVTQKDLAEQSVDDLSDIEELDKNLAAKLIMAARKPWFE